MKIIERLQEYDKRLSKKEKRELVLWYWNVLIIITLELFVLPLVSFISAIYVATTLGLAIRLYYIHKTQRIK